jgi:hypothetical protein
LIEFVPLRVAVEFRQPPFAPVRRRGAILTTFVPMPETAVNEEGGFVFGQEDIDGDGAAPHPNPLPIRCGEGI